MRNALDFSSWQAVFSTLIGLVTVTLVMVGIRLLVMQTVQRRRERENRQINERLRTLIAAYKTLGGSFTGNLLVDPTHLRDLARLPRDAVPDAVLATGGAGDGGVLGGMAQSERRRRIRDAVEAALSDIVLLGTARQVELAVAAANDLVAGRPVETAALVTELRNFIREALDLEPLSAGLSIPPQGPARPGASGGGARGGAGARGGEAGGRGANGSGGGGGGGGTGAGAALAGGGGAVIAADPHGTAIASPGDAEAADIAPATNMR